MVSKLSWTLQVPGILPCFLQSTPFIMRVDFWNAFPIPNLHHEASITLGRITFPPAFITWLSLNICSQLSTPFFFNPSSAFLSRTPFAQISYSPPRHRLSGSLSDAFILHVCSPNPSLLIVRGGDLFSCLSLPLD